jgi:hypothetical protein
MFPDPRRDHAGSREVDTAIPASDPAHLHRRLEPMDTSVRDHAGSILPIRRVNEIFFLAGAGTRTPLSLYVVAEPHQAASRSPTVSG